MAGRLDLGGVAGAPAVARHPVPPDQRDRVGRERPGVRLELAGEGAERDELEDLARGGWAGGGVVGEQRRARRVEAQERQLGVGGQRGGRDQREPGARAGAESRPAAPAGAESGLAGGAGDRDLLPLADEHHPRVASVAEPLGAPVSAQVRGTVERAAGERDPRPPGRGPG